MPKVVIPDDFELDLNAFLTPRCYENDLASVIVPCGMIKDRVKRLAFEIHDVIKDQPITMLCVLKGSYRFFTSLVDELTEARRSCVSLLNIDFVRIKSTTGTQSSGTVNIMGLSNINELKDQNVLIVEDIIDSGRTLSHLLNTLKQVGVKKAWTSVLLAKRVKREVEVPQDFVAFEIPNKFIVGYGLDYNQKFRDLRHICVVGQQGLEKYDIKTA